MAPYKKKPKDLAPIWSSSMKAAFCWSRALPEPGPPAGKRRYCVARAAGPRFLRFPASVSLPKENGLRFMPSFIATKTSGPLKWSGFSSNCSNICGDMWSFFGMEAGPIRGLWLKSSLKNIRSFILNGFPVTPLNLTPMNLSGTFLSDLWRTGRRKMFTSLSAFYIRNSCACGVPENCFGHVCMLQICLGFSFYYLCVCL